MGDDILSRYRYLLVALLSTVCVLSSCSNKVTDTSQEDDSYTNLQSDEVAGETEVNESKDDTKVEAGIGEGTSSMDMPDLAKCEEHQLGTVITIDNSENKYELTVDSGCYTEIRNEYMESSKKVLLLDYSYTNISGELLLVDSISFQLVNKEGSTIYEPYYFSERKVPVPVDQADSAQGQVAFAIDDEEDEFILVYQDIVDEEKKYAIPLSNIE